MTTPQLVDSAAELSGDESKGEEMQNHTKIVGILHAVFGAFGLLAAIVMFLAIAGGGLLSGDAGAMAITALVGTVIAVFLAVLSLPAIIGGVGLINGKSWARVLVLVLGFINLLNFPIGTALGIYTIWALMKTDAPAQRGPWGEVSG